MVVRQQIKVGLAGSSAAETSAALIASALCPSTPAITSQPYDSKRARVSSVNQPRTSPSIEMLLSSYSAISLPA
jgi:hypothetical protein